MTVSILAEQIGVEKGTPNSIVLISTSFRDAISEYWGRRSTSSNVKALDLIRIAMEWIVLEGSDLGLL